MNDSAGSAGLKPAPAAAPEPPPSSRPQGQAAPAQAAGSLCDALSRPGRSRLVALLTAAVTTLVVPVAVRRMIDFGFDAEHIGLIDQYFGVMIAVVAVLALASASRYYLVTTLGERVVADIRAAVFGHLIALSAPFFDTARTGELTSRLTADTTQIKSAVGSSRLGRAPQPRAVSRLRHHDGGDEPEALGLRAGRDPVDRAAAGRFRPRGAPALARRAGHARRCLGLCRRADRRGAHLAGLHQRAAGEQPLLQAVERAYRAAIQSTKARAMLTAIIIFLASASVVVVLWVGAQDVIAGAITPGRLSQFVLFAVFAASGLGQLSEVWGELSQAAARPSG